MAGKWSRTRLRQRSANVETLVAARRLAHRLCFACVAVLLAIACLALELNRYLRQDTEMLDVHGRRLVDPKDQMDAQTKRDGAIVLHGMGLLYMFVAIALVCDECFVPALEVISEVLDLSPDVAGATFMAAGGSAPEFFTSLIGSLLVKSDIGTGTIIGSAVFNVLFVIGACALISPEPLALTWFPLARDCSFYAVDLISVTIVLLDGQVMWWEAFVLFCLYLIYATFMSRSERVEAWVNGTKELEFDVEEYAVKEVEPAASDFSSNKLEVQQMHETQLHPTHSANCREAAHGILGGRDAASSAATSSAHSSNIASSIRSSNRSNISARSDRASGVAFGQQDSISSLKSEKSSHHNTFRHKSIRQPAATAAAAAAASAAMKRRHSQEAGSNRRHSQESPACRTSVGRPNGDHSAHAEPGVKTKTDFDLTNVVPTGGHSTSSACNSSRTSISLSCAVSTRTSNSSLQIPDMVVSPYGSQGSKDGNEHPEESQEPIQEEEEEENEPLSIAPPWDGGIKDWIGYCICLPILFCLVYTIPDVRRPGYRKYFVVTFFMAICWIAIFTWVMMWFAIAIAETCGLEETIMGYTILAAGTSVPDLLTSMIVARQGQGDMAVSSSVGSNIFDVTVGLPVPWMVYAAVTSGKAVQIKNEGLEVCVLLLLGMLAFTVGTIVTHRWVLNKWCGGTLMFLYVLFEVVVVGLTFAPEGELKLIHV